MKYLKLIAKPNTWFKEGSECFLEINKRSPETGWFISHRPTIEEWEKIKCDGMAAFRGTRIIQDKYEIDFFKLPVGTEREDGEICSCDEFEVIETDEYKELL